MTRAAAPSPPPPEVQVTVRADADKSREWWEAWNELAPIERRRPATEVLAEIRKTDDT